MAEKSFPLENTEYSAKDAQLWFATRTSGVYAGSHLPVVTAGGMGIVLGMGIAWISYDMFGGCVYGNTTAKSLAVEMSDAAYDRYDRVCVRLEILNDKCHAYIKKGTPAESPVPPELQRDTAGYEISVARIRVGAGATFINAADITDERLDPSVCGLMTDGVTGVDTSVLNAQFEALLNDMRANLQQMYEELPKTNLISYYDNLLVDEWSLTSQNTYTITRTVSGILSSDEPFYDANMTGVTDMNDLREIRDAFDCLIKIEPTANTLTYYATRVPMRDLPIKIKVVR